MLETNLLFLDPKRSSNTYTLTAFSMGSGYNVINTGPNMDPIVAWGRLDGQIIPVLIDMVVGGHDDV